MSQTVYNTRLSTALTPSLALPGAAGYIEKVERQLKSLNATIRVRKGDSRFDELLTYGRELEVGAAQ